jgi:soluble lytic murein transglycosylase
VWLLASALAVLGTAEAMSAARHKSESSDRKNAAEAELHKPGSPDRKKDKKTADAEHHKSESSHPKKGKKAAEAERHKKAAEVVHHRHVIHPPAGDGPAAPLSPDLAAAKQAIELVRHGKAKDATALAASIGDPVAAKLVEWARLRHSDSEAGFDRYVAFIRANADWPSMQLLRRRAETRLWKERRDGAAVHRFVGDNPTSAIGRLALARAEMGEGDRARAEKEIRAVWQSASLSAETEAAVLAAFPDVLTRADHVARMDRRIGAKDFRAAMRAAKHVGEAHVAIVKACTAAEAKSANGGALLDAIHTDARGDLGYALCRVHWLLRNDAPGSNLHGRIVTPKENIAAAVKLMLAASPEDLQRQDTDEW